MVVFTCQHCNEALKKPAVEKHYNNKCRRNPYLTCVDCLQDFHDEEYVEHTACVSEDQRYGDKNFVPKPVAVKQNNWIDVIHNFIKNNKHPKYFSLFEKLKTVPNIPRKRHKFINFMNCAMNMRNVDLAGEIFDLFLEEFEKAKSLQNGNKSKSIGSVENETVNNSIDKKRNHVSESDAHDEILINGSSDSNNQGKKKKSKKHKEKHKKSLESFDNDNDGDIGDQENEEIHDKKKKNKKSKENKDSTIDENQFADEVNVNQGAEELGNPVPEQTIENGEKLSKKELKKLKKKKKFEAELKQIEDEKPESETIQENDSEEVIVDKKSKKKKRKANISESESDNLKKQKVEETATVEPPNNTLQLEEPSQKNKFHWDEVIKEILKNSSDNEVSLKRLTKKVLAEYQAVKGNRESYEELMSKFHKKINKIPGVKILKDKAKLITVD